MVVVAVVVIRRNGDAETQRGQGCLDEGGH